MTAYEPEPEYAPKNALQNQETFGYKGSKKYRKSKGWEKKTTSFEAFIKKLMIKTLIFVLFAVLVIGNVINLSNMLANWIDSEFIHSYEQSSLKQ